MDVAAARAEVESWLRALAAPMTPPLEPAPVPSAAVTAIAPTTRPGVTAATPPRRATAATGMGDPVLETGSGAAMPAGPVAPSGPVPPPGPVHPPEPVLPPGPVLPRGPIPPGAVLPRDPMVSPAPASPREPAAAGDWPHTALRADLDPAGPATGDAGLVPAPGSASGDAAAAPGRPRAADREIMPAASPDPRPTGRESWPLGADPVGAALAPLLPPPAAPAAFRTWPDASTADTPEWTEGYPGNVPAGTPALADLADLLAGVLEDETRALGVLELEP